mgnify:CR=1 FL=1
MNPSHASLPCLLACAVLAAACGSPAPVGRGDAAGDLPHEAGDAAPPGDADDEGLPERDAADVSTLDLPDGADAPAPPDAPVDARPPDATDAVEADVPPVAPLCTPPAPLPSWASSDGDAIALDCGTVLLDVRAVEPSILRLAWRDGDTAPSHRAGWAVLPSAGVPTAVEAGADGDRFVLCTAALRLEVAPDRCRITVADASGTVLLHEPEGAGYAKGVGLQRTLSREALPGDHFYGLGERTGALDRRGRRLATWNQDGYSSQLAGWPPDLDPMYAGIPFFVGLRETTAFGLLTDVAWRSTFDFAASNANRWSVTVDGPPLIQHLIGGPTIATVLAAYGRLAGTTPLPPLWSLGFQQSKWGYSPAAKVREIADGFRSRRIPADGIWLDIQHMDGFRSFTFDPATFPDPAGLVSGLASIGFQVTAIVDPGLKKDPGWDVYDAGLAGGHFLQDDGAPWSSLVWPGESVFPDFTSATTRAWWASLVPRLTSLGVRGIWLDMNEPTTFVQAEDGNTVPGTIVCDGDGIPTTMAQAHNVYGLLESHATREGMAAARPDRRPFLLTRAGFAGTQRYAALWTGDAPSTWPTLATTLPMLLGLGMSGLPFVGSDVGGYGGGATPELYARWMQVGSISPFFRAHARDAAPPQEPWALGGEAEAISRAVIQDRYRLLPYLYSLFRQSELDGSPILRPAVFEFQDDPATHAQDDVAMLGPWMLFAPVLQEGAVSRTVRLPAGRWFERDSGAVVEGPVEVTVDTPTLAAFPGWIREGAILPRGPLVQWTGEAPLAPLFLDVYPAAAGTTFALHEDAGDGLAYRDGAYARTVFRARRTELGSVVSAGPREGSRDPPDRLAILRVHRVDSAPTAVTLDGAAVPAAPGLDAARAAGLGWWWDDRDLSLVVVLPDTPPYTLDLAYDPALQAPAPPVAVTFRVTVPAGTPASPPVSIATSATGWVHQSLPWTVQPGASPGVAEGTVLLPRGQWFFYKYARGDWATVEKWPGCVEAANRYGFAQAWPVREDSVAAWAEGCR